jgi:hypothetical protein
MRITALRLTTDTVFVEDTTARTVTTTAYGNGSSALSATIPGPPSGQIEITIVTRVDNTGGSNTLSSFTASGSVSATIYTPTDPPATQWSATTSAGPFTTTQIITCTPGETVTVTAQHRVVGSTGNLRYRSLKLRQL